MKPTPSLVQYVSQLQCETDSFNVLQLHRLQCRPEHGSGISHMVRQGYFVELLQSFLCLLFMDC